MTDETQLANTIEQLYLQREEALEARRALERELGRAHAELERTRAEFHTILTTIGGTLYTRGNVAKKWQTDLLSFVRDARARMERHTPAALVAAEDAVAAHLCERAAARLRSGEAGPPDVEAVARAAIEASK